MSDTNSPGDPMDFDDQLLDALAAGDGLPSTAGHDTAGELLRNLAAATDADFTDEAAVKAVLSAAAAGGVGAGGASTPTGIWARALAWVSRNKLFAFGALLVAALLAALVVSLVTGSGATGSSGSGALGTSPSRSASSAVGPASGTTISGGALPGTSAPVTATSSAATTTSGSPGNSGTSTRSAGTAVTTPQSTTRTAAPPAIAPDPSRTSASAVSSTSSNAASPSSASSSIPSPSSSPSSSPSKPSCQVRTKKLVGAAAVFTRTSATQATLTWRDPFGTGKDVTLTYTAHQVGSSALIDNRENLKLTSGVVGGQYNGGIALSLHSAERSSTTPAGLDVTTEYTYGGQQVTVDDASFAITDIDGPAATADGISGGVERVFVADGTGAPVNSSYLTGSGTALDPWRRAETSSPAEQELDAGDSAGVVRLQQARILPGASQTISYRAVPTRSRTDYTVWLTRPDITVTVPGC